MSTNKMTTCNHFQYSRFTLGVLQFMTSQILRIIFLMLHILHIPSPKCSKNKIYVAKNK
jgi:hypothetical protein